MTVCIQIGNSDDKLTQKLWAEFVERMGDLIASCATETHFSGTSDGDKPWQNACWVFSMSDSRLTRLTKGVKFLREEYGQNSVAVLTGRTWFA